MKLLTVRFFYHNETPVKPGSVVNPPRDVALQLIQGGYAKPVVELPPGEMIRSTLGELNAAGPWGDCPPLSPTDRQQAEGLEAAVNEAGLTGNSPELAGALERFKGFWLSRRILH